MTTDCEFGQYKRVSGQNWKSIHSDSVLSGGLWHMPGLALLAAGSQVHASWWVALAVHPYVPWCSGLIAQDRGPRPSASQDRQPRLGLCRSSAVRLLGTDLPCPPEHCYSAPLRGSAGWWGACTQSVLYWSNDCDQYINPRVELCLVQSDPVSSKYTYAFGGNNSLKTQKKKISFLTTASASLTCASVHLPTLARKMSCRAPTQAPPASGKQGPCALPPHTFIACLHWVRQHP